MIKIAISEAALVEIAKTLPEGTVLQVEPRSPSPPNHALARAPFGAHKIGLAAKGAGERRRLE